MPGAHVLILDEEWLVRGANQCHPRGYELECLGVSETVRHREALFLTEIEGFVSSTHVIRKWLATPPPFSPTLAAACTSKPDSVRPCRPAPVWPWATAAPIDALPFQLLPTHQALEQVRPRFLVADSAGLGETFEAGILVSQLIRRGNGRRILVAITKSTMRQFQKELWTWFSICLTRLDSANIQRIRRQLPANHNRCLYHDKTISTGAVKKDSDHRHYLENTFWDIIVIDETHNVSLKGSSAERSKRGKLANLPAHDQRLVRGAVRVDASGKEGAAPSSTTPSPAPCSNATSNTSHSLRPTAARMTTASLGISLRNNRGNHTDVFALLVPPDRR